MKQSKPAANKQSTALRRLALSLPEVSEGAICDKAAFKARGKMFVSIGGEGQGLNLMLKLGDSLAEAAALAAKQPGCYKVGGTGWVSVTLAPGAVAPTGLLERWTLESYRLLAPKSLVATLEGGESGPGAMKPVRSVRQVKSRRKESR